MTKRNTTLVLTESAVMIALAFILSMLKVVDMPYGGSVTAFSMLPIVIIAYRHGTVNGLVAGFAYSLLQMIMGMHNLSYATSAAAAVAIILLDYVVAFTVLGLGGIFRKSIKSSGTAMAAGALVCCVLRFICHVISGCTVWAGVSIPTAGGLIYSLGYNATYMIPETLLTVVGAFFIGSVFTLTETTVVRKKSENGSVSGVLAALPITIAVTIAFAFIFGMMQNPDDGSFDITLVASAGINSWLPVIVTTVVGAITSACVYVISKNKAKND